MTGISHLVARSPNASKNSDELKNAATSPTGDL